ncbi:MAG: nickel pincer cofactor biosynthesis protein LarC [Planctomycetes bacterium]|nr:nickel pincer cofactor biosynthesis protein LarC [Planctomycetota bacterium]
MNIAYLDCFSGVAGDMLLAAWIDAGLPTEVLHDTVRRLNVPEATVTVERVKKGGIAASYVNVVVDASVPQKHRHLHHIVKIIDAATIPPRVAERAKRVFARLAEAEALVHNTTVEKVHFHEVGAVDAIVDIVGTCAAIEHLHIDRIVCSPIAVGSGTVTCEHGVMPVPAPATAHLLRGVPIAACDEIGELATPTGVALAVTLAERFGPPPAMTLRAVGVGAGTREGKTRPNVLRVLLGEAAGPAAADELETDSVVVLECQVDDATGQALAFAMEQVFAAGAPDAYLTPIMMKKGRPGQLLTVLCPPERCGPVESAVLRHTSTLGVRRSEAARSKLVREHQTVETPYGAIRVKIGRGPGGIVHCGPEYDDCAAAARRSGATLADVQQAALEAQRRRKEEQTRSP